MIARARLVAFVLLTAVSFAAANLYGSIKHLHQTPTVHISMIYKAEGHTFHAVEEVPEEGLAVLTRYVQRIIWRHQHRSKEECAQAQYIRHRSPYGLGAQMHRAAGALGHAIDQNYVFFWHPLAGAPYTSVSRCAVHRNWLCYFRPPTNCTPEVFANPNNTMDELVPKHGHHIPRAIRELLLKVAPQMGTAQVNVWWRAQAVAYLMRFNHLTADELYWMRISSDMVRIVGASGPAVDHLRQQAPPLFPLPAGTISAHVRHGEKGREMQLIPFAKYQEAAVHLVKMQPLSLMRTLFLSTEDPDAVAQLLRNGTEGWIGLYSDIPRSNIDGRLQASKNHQAPMQHFVQLLMALECDAWVGTRNSNWGMLIDELRCVWVAKCSNPFVEVGHPKDWEHLVTQ